MEQKLISEENEVQHEAIDSGLRWYQVAARNQTIQHLKAGKKRVCVVMPTGTGKTKTSVSIAGHPDLHKFLGVSNRPIRVLFIAHRHRLLTQAEKAFSEDLNVELICQSMASDIPQSVIDKGFDIVFQDEGHHEACMSFQLLLDKMDCPIVYFSATPDRADGLLIKVDAFVEPISREQAVEEGFISPTSVFSFVDAPSKEKVEVLKDIFDNFAHIMEGTMVFVKTKKEVLELEKHLRGLGYTAVGLITQSKKETEKVLNSFSSGETQFLINCAKIGEGVDVKGCVSVVIGRQLGSYALLNQLIGRSVRKDSKSQVFELINPLSASNLDSTRVVGEPEKHLLYAKLGNEWKEYEFDYSYAMTNKQMGLVSSVGNR